MPFARIRPNVIPGFDEWTIVDGSMVLMPMSTIFWRDLRPTAQTALSALRMRGNARAPVSDRMEIAGALQNLGAPPDRGDAITIGALSEVGRRETEARLADPMRQTRATAPLDVAGVMMATSFSLAYRPDFYIPSNAVGYTGDLNNYPTIYFRTATELGSITQKHRKRQEVGRSYMVQANEAEYTREISALTGHLLEFSPDSYHISRSNFIPITGAHLQDATPEMKAIFQAIMYYTFVKGSPQMQDLLVQSADGQWVRRR